MVRRAWVAGVGAVRLALGLAVVVGAAGRAQAAERIPTEPPETVAAELDLVYGTTPEQVLKLDVYRPRQAAGLLPGVVLVHGGGWVKGDKERFRPLAFGLAARGYVVANVEYRLAGVAKYPAAVRDCHLAVRYFRANAARWGLDPERIGVWGGSAGGHLVGLLAAAPDEPAFQQPGEWGSASPRVQAAVVMAGPCDLTSERLIDVSRKQGAESFTYQWLGKLYDDAPELYRAASPITYFSSSTCPVLFLTGDLDAPERDVPALDRLRQLKVPAEQVILAGGKHGCWMQMPWYEQCLGAVDAFFQKHLRPAAR